MIESEENSITYLLTYHSAKGLDFETVFLPYFDETFPLSFDNLQDKTLLYVAMTRSKLNLYFSYSVNSSNIIQRITNASRPDDINFINASDMLEEDESLDDTFDIF